jgi:hypothetical protein
MTKFKPCPFCTGNSPEIYVGMNCYSVQCTSCETTGTECNSRKEAIKWWNYRPVEETLQIEISLLRESLRVIESSEPEPFGSSAHGLRDIARKALETRE